MAILGTSVHGQIPGTDSYTPETGDSNRIVAIFIAAEDFFNRSLTSVTLGGVSATLGVRNSVQDNAASRYMIGEVWYIKEADIPVGSSAIATTWDAAVDWEEASLYTFSNRDQTTPIASSQSTGTSGSALNIAGSLTLSSEVDAVTLLASQDANIAGCTIDGSWNERYDADTGGHMFVADKSAISTTDNFTITFGGLSKECSLTTVGFAVNAPAQSITSINGGSAVTDGQQDVAVVADGYSALPTAGLYDDDATGNYDTDVTSSLAGTATNFTFDAQEIKALIANAYGSPFTSASHTLSATFTYGAETADGAFTLNPATGWDVVEIASFSKAAGSVGKNWLGTIADTGQILWNTNSSDVTIGATGVITFSTSTGSALAYYFDITGNLVDDSEFETQDYWTIETNWSIAGGVASHSSGVSSSLYQETTIALESGESYEVTFTLANYVGGNITPYLSGGTGTAGTARSANGTYVETIVAGTGNTLLDFRASVTFVGDISDVNINKVGSVGVWKPFTITYGNEAGMNLANTIGLVI